MAISTNQKPAIYRNLYENTAPTSPPENIHMYTTLSHFCYPPTVYLDKKKKRFNKMQNSTVTDRRQSCMDSLDSGYFSLL